LSRLVVDPTKELSMLVYEHKYEEAFTYALQRVMFGSSPGYALSSSFTAVFHIVGIIFHRRFLMLVVSETLSSDDYQLNAELEMSLVKRSDLWRVVKKPIMLKDASTGAPNTSTAADIQGEFTPPPEEVSSIRKRTIATIDLPYIYIQRCESPTACAQNVSVSRNVRMRLITSQSSMLVNATRLPTTSEQHRRTLILSETMTREMEPPLPTTSEQHRRTLDIIRNHDTGDETTVPISRIFDRFRNMSMNDLQSNYAVHIDMVQNAVTHKLFTPCTGDTTADCPTTTDTSIPVSNTLFASNEPLAPNAHKRKNPHPLSTARPKEASSSRNVKKQLMPASSKAHSANTYKNYPPVNSQIHEPYSSRSQDDPPSYMDLGDCDQQCRYCGCLFWYNERLKGSNYSGQAEYHLRCEEGHIYMRETPDPAALIQQLLKNTHFMENI
ncbi:hypothetical protein Tco_1514915, partial [Tanacetum coccineum]